MKLRTLRSLSLFCVWSFSALAIASYDDSWYRQDFWSGEYPNGVAIVKENVSVPARLTMDRDIPASISCQLPFKAVFHPWNEARDVRYVTAAKILSMQAKEDFEYETQDGVIKAKKGDLLEYLIYYSEGMFALRYKGKVYTADEGILEKTNFDYSMVVGQEEWFQVECVGGLSAWVYMKDLLQYDDDTGELIFRPGLGDWWRGFREYGKVVDLTDDDLK